MKYTITLFIVAFLLNSVKNTAAQSYIINTVAGDSNSAFSGDGGPAINAALQMPYCVEADSNANFFIADQSNNRIRKVNASGIITTIAGNGTNGYSGDGGQATAAEILNCFGITVDNSGNIYLCDGNSRVRKINSGGIITTIAGNNIAGYTGDGGLATAAELNSPLDIAVDKSGNVYIADYNNFVVRKIDINDTITTIAGNGNPNFSGDGGPATAAAMNSPIAIAVDDSGGIYIADENNNRVRKVDTHGIMHTIAGNGTAGYTGDGGHATAAAVNAPNGIAVDGKGNVYIAEEQDNVVRKVTPQNIITTIAGDANYGFYGDGGPATAAWLNVPSMVSVDQFGKVYICDQLNNRIRALTTVTGIDEVTQNNDVRVYPNPSNGVFTLQVESEKLKVESTIEVYNMLGQTVLKECSIPVRTTQGPGGQHSEFKIDLSNQPKGVYLYRLTDNTGTFSSSGKLMVE